MTYSSDASPHIDALTDVVNAADAEITSIKLANTTLASQLNTAQNNLVAAQDALAAEKVLTENLKTTILDKNATIVALNAEIARLNAIISPPPVVVSVIPAAPAGWQTTFSDDFRKATIDKTKWNVRLGPLGAPREEYNKAENIATGPNGLIGTTKREEIGGKHWSSWYIDSAGLMPFSMNSRVECEFSMDSIWENASGLWPCPLWLRGDWPGEIDGPEMYGWPFLNPARTDAKVNTATRGNYQSTIHSNTMGGSTNKKTVRQPVNAVDGNIKAGVKYRCAIDLTDEGITTYFGQAPIADLYNRPNPMTWAYLATLGIPKTAFTGTGHARLQTQVGDSYWGPSNASTVSPWKMNINWFRILKKV